MECNIVLGYSQYALVLINPERKHMILKRAASDIKNAICLIYYASTGKQVSHHLESDIFCRKLYAMMGWNLEKRYRVIGEKQTIAGEDVVFFDLNTGFIYEY